MQSAAQVARGRPTVVTRRCGAAALACGLALAGCGLRVDHSQLQAADRAALNSGTGTAGSGVGVGAGSGSGALDTGGAGSGATTGGSAAAASSGGGSAGGGGTGGTGATGAGGPTVPAAPAGGNGGATDVGVSASTITIGNVSDLGGPVPGLFRGGPLGTQAYIDYINSQGGIYGRKLKLISADDQLQCNQNEAAYQSLVNQVFAFVGSWSLDDYCGAQILAQHKDVPAVQQALSIQFTDLPNAYSEAPYNAGAPTGYFEYFKAKYPDAIRAVGTLVGNQPSAVQSWKYYQAAAQSVGYKVIYEDDFPPAQSNFTADVIRMRNAGVKMVFIIAVNAPDVAAFSQEAYQQNWKPEVFVSPIAYFGAYIPDAGGAAAVEGQYIPATQARFLGEDAAQIPEVGVFDHWIASSAPGFAVDQFSSSSWANTALFVKAAEMVGPHLTRKALLAALAQIHQFNDLGMMTPTDIAAKASSTCYLMLQIRNGKYEKVDDPATGYRCDGTFFRYGG